MRQLTKFLMIFVIIGLFSIQSVIGQYLFDADEINGNTNQLTDSVTSRVSMLFLAVLVIISIVGLMVDFGSIGIVVGCIIALLVLTSLGLVLISVYSFMSFVLMCGILIYKMV